MITIRCCVIDDEPLASQLIASYINKTPFMELVGVYASAQEAIKTILDDKIDVVFLDIQMPQLNGMEFARIIPPTCRIVFTTAFESYAVQGYKAGAIDYLLKPVSYDEFVGAANRVLQWVELNRKAYENSMSNDYLIVKSEYKLVQIPVKDILYVEGLKDYVKIYTDNGARSVMTLMSMKLLDRYLPASQFLRVHRSYIVNTTKIKVIERNRIVFGNTYIPVSESYKQIFSDFVNKRTISAVRDDD